MSDGFDLGLWLGYPACCRADCDMRLESIWDGDPRGFTEAQEEAGGGTGFVPCPACALRVVTGAPLASLIRDRQCAVPFPHYDGEADGCDL